MANKLLTSRLILRTVQPRRFLSATSSLWLPKYTELRLPALSPTMEQGNILEWNLKEGDEFQEADSLAEVETDKATVAWELQGDEGYIAKLFMPEGSKNVKVGTLVGIFVENQGDVAAFQNVTIEEIEGGAVSQTTSAPAETPAAAPAPVSAASSYPKHKMMTLPALLGLSF